MTTNEKYKRTDTLFAMRFKDGDIHKVYPFNAEKEQFLLKGKLQYDVSWSHGGTHMKYKNGSYAGRCGVSYFEENAKEIT